MEEKAGFFRWLWRLNTILIVAVAGGVAVLVGALLLDALLDHRDSRRQARVGQVVASEEEDADLELLRVSLVPGTTVYRGELTGSGSRLGLGSGKYQETRNLLIIAPGETKARWLLPDHDRVVAERHDLAEPGERWERGGIVATAVLVRQRQPEPLSAGGRLLLFDPAAATIVEVADAVRTLHSATLADGEIALLFERERRFTLATFDARSLEKRQERTIEVPRLP